MDNLQSSWIGTLLSYMPTVLEGLKTSLLLSLMALILAFILSAVFTVILTLKIRGWSQLIKFYVTVFTGTPLLIQIFIIYYGPGQFPSLQHYPLLWHIISHPWFCATLALLLNSAAYTTLLFEGTVKTIPKGQWQACQALGMSRFQTLKIIFSYGFRRALSAYSNEIILVFKSTSLTSTITLMDIMGYTQFKYVETYDVSVFICAGVIYLVVNGLLTLLLRAIEYYALRFERRC